MAEAFKIQAGSHFTLLFRLQTSFNHLVKLNKSQIFLLLFCFFPASFLAADYSSKPVILVMDASGSMGKSFHGIARIEAAQYIINEHLAAHNVSRPFGLVAYGNGIDGCKSQRLYVPLGTGNRKKISDAVMSMRASGNSPIQATLELIESKILPGQKDAVIIFISDGVESCGGNPNAVAERIIRKYPGVKIHVIGLSVEKPDAVELSDLAEKGNGKFFDVKTSKDFNFAMNESLGVKSNRSDRSESDPQIFPDKIEKPVFILNSAEITNQNSESVRIKVEYQIKGISQGNYVLNMSVVTPIPYNPWETLVDPGVKQVVFLPVSRYNISSGKGVLEIEFPLKEIVNIPILVQGELWETTKVPNLLDLSNRLPLKLR